MNTVKAESYFIPLYWSNAYQSPLHMAGFCIRDGERAGLNEYMNMPQSYLHERAMDSQRTCREVIMIEVHMEDSS